MEIGTLLKWNLPCIRQRQRKRSTPATKSYSSIQTPIQPPTQPPTQPVNHQATHRTINDNRNQAMVETIQTLQTTQDHRPHPPRRSHVQPSQHTNTTTDYTW